MNDTPPGNRSTPLFGRQSGAFPMGEAPPLHQQLVEGAADWLWQCNRDYVFDYSNPWVEKLLGHTPSQLRGRSLFDLMHPDDVAETRLQLESHWLRRQPLLQLRCRFVHRNGDILPFDTNAMPFSDRFQHTQGFHAVSRVVQRATAYGNTPEDA
ncbi:MAG TPA: PAS domain-containing protein [Hyphomicrobiales bacterium]|nr:PAS domain-containing protein [Hyphomicrobiales bacterium]